MRINKPIYLILFIALLISCDNPYVVTPGTQGKNIVTGLSITDEASNLISIWGGSPNRNYPSPPKVTPDSSRCEESEHCFVPEDFRLKLPYPNPVTGSQNIGFSTPIPDKAKIWVETAYWSGNQSALPFNSSIDRPFQSVTLFEGELQQAAEYSFTLDLRLKCNGGKFDPGFHRVFLKTESGFLAWQDIYVLGEQGSNPPGLEGIGPEIGFCSGN